MGSGMTYNRFARRVLTPWSVTSGARFLTFWVVQEPNLTGSRLAMLVDLLASGADVFSGGEMEVVLESAPRP
jgi:hypothetical protein